MHAVLADSGLILSCCCIHLACEVKNGVFALGEFTVYVKGEKSLVTLTWQLRVVVAENRRISAGRLFEVSNGAQATNFTCIYNLSKHGLQSKWYLIAHFINVWD